VLDVLDVVLAREELAHPLDLDDALGELLGITDHLELELDGLLRRGAEAGIGLSTGPAFARRRARANAGGRVAAVEGRGAGLGVHDLDDLAEAAAGRVGVRPGNVDARPAPGVTSADTRAAGLGEHVVVEADAQNVALVWVGEVAIDAGRRLVEAPAVPVKARLIDPEAEALATGQAREEASVGLARLVEALEDLFGVLERVTREGGQLGVAQAAEAVVGTLNAYGLAAEEAAGVTDRLLRITQLTNFQARDFEVGLSKAAATGATFNQNLNDVLITMGLLRNRNIDASSSATALREAIRRVGSDQRAQQAIQQTGVDVFDKQTGRMRSLTDVMTEFAQATEGMTDAERNRRVVTAFGARGLLAFNAVLNAAFTTTRNGEQVTLRGAEAIAAMREEMARTEGTAAEFRDKLLDTFEGQKTLLKGTLQTFAIVLGEPFAKVFKPIVGAVTDALNFLIRAFQSLPSGVKKAIATFVVAAGAVVALIGGIIAAKAAVVLLGIGLKALGITLGGVIAMMLPAILIFGLLAGVVAGFVIAIRRDIGGIGTFFRRVFDRIKLFVQAMGQLFEEGGFSGAVREELNRAENQGVKQFAIRVFQIIFRIRRFFEGIAEGFGAAIEQARPAFEAFAEALGRLGRAFGFVGSAADSVAGLQSDRFAASGARVGEVLGKIVTFIVQAMTAVIDVITGIVEGFRSMGDFLGEVFGFIGESFGELGADIKELLKSMGLMGSEAESSGNTFLEIGRVIGKVLGGIVGVVGLALAGVVRVVRGVIRLIRNVGESLGRFAAGFVQLFTDPVEGIKNLLGGLLGFFLSIGDAILSIFGGGIDDIQKTIDEFGESLVFFFTELIPRWVRDGLSAVGQFFVDIWTGIKSFVGGIVTGIGEFFTGLWNGLVSGLSRVGAFFARVVLGIRNFFMKVGASITAFFTETIPNAFRKIVNGIKAFFEPVVEFIRGIFRSIASAVDRIIAFLGRLAAKIPSRFRPAFLDRVVEAGDAATARIESRERDAAAAAARLSGPSEPTGTAPVSEAALIGRPLVVSPATPVTPAAAEARSRAVRDERLIDAIVASGTQSAEAAERVSQRPINVRLDVDGDTLASTTVRARREAAARSFAPVPAT